MKELEDKKNKHQRKVRIKADKGALVMELYCLHCGFVFQKKALMVFDPEPKDCLTRLINPK